jgi:hypothetical protein
MNVINTLLYFVKELTWRLYVCYLVAVTRRRWYAAQQLTDEDSSDASPLSDNLKRKML